MRGLSRAYLWGEAGSRERERRELRGDASLRFSSVKGERELWRFLDVDGLVTAVTACCRSFAQFQPSVPGSAGERLGVAWEAR